MTLPLVRVAGDAQVDWGDGSVGAYTAHHHYGAADTYTATVTDATFTGIDVGLAWDRQACLVSVDAWEGDTGAVDLGFAFEGATNLERVAAPPVPITGMAGAFMGAESFNQDMSGWNVSAVTDLGGTFAGATSFNGDVSGWDTSNVTDMSYMFMNAASFDRPIGGWDVSAVSSIQGMFEGASSFNQDLSGWVVDHIWDHWGFDDGAVSWEPQHKPSFG